MTSTTSSEQAGLFDEPRTMARRDDLPGSKVAAEEMAGSGNARSQRAKYLELVRLHPNCTSNELDTLRSYVDRVPKGHRRLPELRQRSLICSVIRKKESVQRWHPEPFDVSKLREGDRIVRGPQWRQQEHDPPPVKSREHEHAPDHCDGCRALYERAFAAGRKEEREDAYAEARQGGPL